MAEDNPGHPLLNQPLLMLKDAFNPHKEIPFKQRLTRPRGPDPMVDVSRSFWDLLTPTERNHPYTPSASPEPIGPVTEEYRILGLTWHTRGVLNSCTLDSFLSGFVRWVRMTEGFLLQKMFYPDRVGMALLKIARRAIGEGNTINSEWVKDQWLEAILPDGYTKPFDARGLEEYAVFQHLIEHSGLNFKVRCKCGIQYLWSAFYRIWELRDLMNLPMELSGFNASYRIFAKCGTCHQARTYVGITPFPLNWLFIIQLDGIPNAGNPPFNAFPKKLRFPAPNQSNYFLAIISYNIPGSGEDPDDLGHQVSMHRIRRIWYLHDGLQSPAFKKYPNQEKLDIPGAYVLSAVYFREHRTDARHMRDDPESSDDSSNSTEDTSLSSFSSTELDQSELAVKKPRLEPDQPGPSSQP